MSQEFLGLLMFMMMSTVGVLFTMVGMPTLFMGMMSTVVMTMQLLLGPSVRSQRAS